MGILVFEIFSPLFVLTRLKTAKVTKFNRPADLISSTWGNQVYICLPPDFTVPSHSPQAFRRLLFREPHAICAWGKIRVL